MSKYYENRYKSGRKFMMPVEIIRLTKTGGVKITLDSSKKETTVIPTSLANKKLVPIN